MGQSYSELRDIINQLKSIDLSNMRDGLKEKDKFILARTNGSSHLNNVEYTNSKNNLVAAIDQYEQEITNTIARLERTLNEALPLLFKESADIADIIKRKTFEEELVWLPEQPPGKVGKQRLFSALALITNWQMPVLVYGNKNSGVLNELRGFDPIYVLENRSEYLELYKTSYDPDQLRKFKLYSWDERDILPIAGFGCIVVYNEFPFISVDQIEDKLAFLNTLLHPGGSIFFNYNDCLIGKNLSMVEQHIMTYNTSEIMSRIVGDIGLTVTQQESLHDDFLSWMVCSKPGTFPFYKKFSSLGAIQLKPETSDYHTKVLHNTYVKKAIINYNIDRNNKKQ